jgi:hypothetical protein
VVRYTVISVCRYVEEKEVNKLTDSLNSPNWADVVKVGATVGLTDSTIEMLVQEDASFSRVNGDTVEYDLNKLYNHPAVQAFRANAGNWRSTAIGYENIIHNWYIAKQRRIITVYSKDYEFSAVHEAGHAVCTACFPPPSQEEIAKEPPHSLFSHPFAFLPSPLPYLTSEDTRIKEINIWYNEENKRHDGKVYNNLAGLSNEKQLVITLGGKVAELMAKTEGHWDVTEIQTKYSSREFDETTDMKVAYELLRKINENSHTKRSLAEFIAKIFSFLENEWSLVIKISDAVISKYDPKICKARLLYAELSSETQALLHQLESTPHLKDI